MPSTCLILLVLALALEIEAAFDPSRWLGRRQSFFATGKHVPSNCHDSKGISTEFRDSYNLGGTTGVLDWCIANSEIANQDPKRLLQGALEASGSNKSMAAGILNALMGFCCKLEDRAAASRMAVELLNCVYDGKDDEVQSIALKPDLVTLALAYSAIVDENPGIAKTVLNKAVDLHPTIQRTISQGPSTSPTLSISSMDESKSWATQIETNYGIQVLYDHEEFAVLSKPSGMVCFHDTRKHLSKPKAVSLVDALLQCDGLSLSGMNPDGSRGLVNRLDKGTSGCLVIAKTNEMHAKLMTQFFVRNVRKSYDALIYLRSSNKNNNDTKVLPNSGTVDYAIDGRPARSTYQVLDRIGTLSARIRMETFQGRTHQVRIHCSRGLQAPIVLDRRYGGQEIMYPVKSRILQKHQAQNQFCLHASTLSIPDFGVHVQAPLPEWWNNVMGELEKS